MVAELTQFVGHLHHFVSKSLLKLVEPHAKNVLLATVGHVATLALRFAVVRLPPGGILGPALKVPAVKLLPFFSCVASEANVKTSLCALQPDPFAEPAV